VITFDPKLHRYTSPTGKVMVSVTTLIKKYVPPFDSQYWSTYKAMKKVLESKGEWDEYKKKVGGWDNVVEYVRHVDKDFAYRKEVMKEKKAFIVQWADEGKVAAELGTFFHKMKEDSVRKSKVVDPYSMKEIGVMVNTLLQDPCDFESSGLFLEALIYNVDKGIAGTADFVMKSGKQVSIKDYKTSKDVSKKSFMDQTLLWPVDHLPNAKYYVYSLQLSLYAWLLEQSGYRIGDLTIEHIDKGSHKTIELVPCNYYKKEIEDIINDYYKSVTDKTISVESYEVIP
jgi:hypothetical protein